MKRIDPVIAIAVGVIALISIHLMGILQASELPEFRIENLRDQQIHWFATGAVAFFLSFFLARWVPRISVAVFSVGWMFILGVCLGLGERAHGLPYLHIQSMWINFIEAWCLGILIATAALLASKIRFEYQLMIGALPFIFAWLIGSLNGATCYGIAFALMMSKKSFWAAVGILFLACIPAAISMIAEFPPISSPSAIKANQFLLYDFRAGANAHTELVLSHVVQSVGPLAFLMVWMALLVVVLRLFKAGHYLAVGLAAFMTAQAALAGLVSLGLLRNPASGVSFPFLSFSGSLLITELIVLGASMGWHSERV